MKGVNYGIQTIRVKWAGFIFILSSGRIYQLNKGTGGCIYCFTCPATVGTAFKYIFL